MTPEERDLHGRLLEAFSEYINHNLKWERKYQTRSAVRSRKALRKVMYLAYERWRQIKDIDKNGLTDEEKDYSADWKMPQDFKKPKSLEDD